MILLQVLSIPLSHLSIKNRGQVYKPGSVLDDHLSRRHIAMPLKRSTSRAAAGSCHICPISTLLRMGFTRPPCLQGAGELLPHHFNLTTALPVSAECFCCTFPMVTHAGRYPASLPCGARTFLVTPHQHSGETRDRLAYPRNLRFSLLFNSYAFNLNQAVLWKPCHLYA